MDRTIDVTTGEHVAFSYELAGIGSRFLAVFIDTLIQILVLVGVGTLLTFIASVWPHALSVHGRPGTFIGSLTVAAAVAGAFLLFFGYFIAFETLWNGRTPGKRIVGIRVVRDGGFPVDVASAVIRNVVRIVEVGLAYYLVSAISALLSPENRRLGDYAAGTIVVREQPAVAEPAAFEPLGEASDDPLVRDLDARQRDLVRRYATRRETLRPAARVALAAQIAEVVRPQLGAQFGHLDDDALLVHVAGALH